MQKSLKELIFFITGECNLACRTCFYSATLDAPAAGTGGELSMAEIERVARSLGGLRALLLSGGEPFLSDKLLPACLAFARCNPLAHIHLPTNGTLPERILAETEALLERLPAVHLTLSFSLDGLEATHDAVKGRAGHFQQVCESVRLLAPLRERHANLEVQVITVVTRENLGDVIPLAEYVKTNLPVDGHGPSPLRGLPRDPSLKPPGEREWRELSRRLLPYQRFWIRRSRKPFWKKRLSLNRLRYLYRLYGRLLAGGRLPFRCPAGWTVGVLEADGLFRHCELSPPVGNVRDHQCDLAAAWLSEEAEARRRELETCACTHACFIQPGIRSSPRAFLASMGG
jgi:MoaA/NifB/PqqE/SkfB family radical SAM enzyme